MEKEIKNKLRCKWYTMKNRCYNKNSIGYKNYGGRGKTKKTQISLGDR